MKKTNIIIWIFFVLTIINIVSVWLFIMKKNDIEKLHIQELQNREAWQRDIVRKADLSKISIALTMYFNDHGVYPNWSNTIDIEKKLVPLYMSVIPKDPKTNKWYFYKNMYKQWAKDAWAILAVKMEDPKDCNVNIYSSKDLNKIIKENNDEITYVEKYLIKKWNYKKWCYYVVIN